MYTFKNSNGMHQPYMFAEGEEWFSEQNKGANKTPSRKDTLSEFQPNCLSKFLELSFIHFDTKAHLFFGARSSKWASFWWRT
jgi:hypothetical protein